MNYPLISEYIEAIKSAEDNFEELSYLRPVLGDDGLPVMTSGNFAVVFKMKDEQSGKFYAVKCFTKEQEGRAEAYREIAKELENVSSPYILSIRYLDKELIVDTDQTTETEFPVLLMDWVEGKILDKYLRENLDDKYALEMLAYRFSQLAQWLIPQPFAHGDLKPDNILVREDGTLVLVDYDGMYVPAMKGQKARELGSPDFRHPLRNEFDFDNHIDDFPFVSILLSLEIISYNPQLYERVETNERLLFSQKDYMEISNSPLLKSVHFTGKRSIDRLYSLFIMILYDERIPPHLFDLLNFSKPIQLIPYNFANNSFRIYDNVNKRLLSIEFRSIEVYVVNSGILLVKEGTYAFISNLSEVEKIKWCEQIPLLPDGYITSNHPAGEWIAKFVYKKYLNSHYIRNFECYVDNNGLQEDKGSYKCGDELNFFVITPLDSLVYIEYVCCSEDWKWPIDTHIRIGYADEFNCYWDVNIDYIRSYYDSIPKLIYHRHSKKKIEDVSRRML